MTSVRYFKKREMDFFGRVVEIEMPDSLDFEQLMEFTAFKNWKKTLYENLRLQNDPKHALHKSPYSLRSVQIKSVTRFGQNLGFVMLEATIQRDRLSEEQERNTKAPLNLPGAAFLRGGAVAMLIILRPKDSRDERYVILTQQPRVPAGSLAFLEIPAGMLDEHKNMRGKVVEEIREETGLDIPADETIDMTELALKESDPLEKNLAKALYSSPGGCDEYIALFLWEKVLDRQEIEDLKGKLTGEKTQNEMITLHVRKYEDLWKEGARDAKTLAAWALYEGLNRSGELQAWRKRKRAQSLTGGLMPKTTSLKKSLTQPW